MSLQHVAWRGDQSTQPLQRQLTWSVMFFAFGGRIKPGTSGGYCGGGCQTPNNSFLATPLAWKAEQRGVQRTPPAPSHMALGRAVLAALNRQHRASTGAGGCAGSSPGTPHFPVGSRTSAHRQLQGVMAQTGRGNRRGSMA